MQRMEPFDKDNWKSCGQSNHSTRASMEKGRYKNCLIEWLIDWLIDWLIEYKTNKFDTGLSDHIYLSSYFIIIWYNKTRVGSQYLEK